MSLVERRFEITKSNLEQIISQKKEIFSLKSQLKQIKIELDGLRNQNIEDDIEILDEMSETWIMNRI